MGWLSDRIGVRATVAIGVGMIAAGLVLSSLGWIWSLFVGHALMGLFGNGGVYPPLLVYVSRWFDRRRGTAIALISSGQYVAGVVWPALFERIIASLGWQTLMLGFAVLVLVTILPATLLLKPTPLPLVPQHLPHITAAGRRIGGMHPNLVQALLCIAGFCCCIPMSVPQAHLVAFCTDIGISPTTQRHHAVDHAGVGLPRPPGVGRAGRSHRRPAHGDGGLGLPGASPSRRSRSPRTRPACSPSPPPSASASPASSRPTRSPSATSSRRRRRRGACRSPCSPP